jgi:hypothetical protein
LGGFHDVGVSDTVVLSPASSFSGEPNPSTSASYVVLLFLEDSVAPTGEPIPLTLGLYFSLLSLGAFDASPVSPNYLALSFMDEDLLVLLSQLFLALLD